MARNNDVDVIQFRKDSGSVDQNIGMSGPLLAGRKVLKAIDCF